MAMATSFCVIPLALRTSRSKELFTFGPSRYVSPQSHSFAYSVTLRSVKVKWDSTFCNIRFRDITKRDKLSVRSEDHVGIGAAYPPLAA